MLISSLPLVALLEMIAASRSYFLTPSASPYFGWIYSKYPVISIPFCAFVPMVIPKVSTVEPSQSPQNGLELSTTASASKVILGCLPVIRHECTPEAAFRLSLRATFTPKSISAEEQTGENPAIWNDELYTIGGCSELTF